MEQLMVEGEGNHFGRDALGILPEELWRLILDKLESSKDILSCFRVCQAWGDILKTDLPNWMFNEIFSSVFPHLETNQILQCRLVSSKWRDTVDSFLENHPSRPVYSEDLMNTGEQSDSVSLLQEKKLEWITIKGMHQLDRWENTEGDPNPFPGRAVWIEVDTANARFCFWMNDFLECFGEHIRHLVLNTTGNQNTYDYFIGMLRQWTAMMGNLRSLRILGKISPNPNPFIPVSQLARYLEIPRLFYVIPSLETLEITDYTKLPIQVQRHLIKIYSGQLKRLKVTDPDVFNQLTFLEGGMPNLKELNLNVKSIRKLELLLNKLEASPLEKLTLSFSTACSFWLNAEDLFSVIGHVGNNLRYLRLKSFPTEPIKDCGANYQAELPTPKLQTLELEGFVNLSLHFIKGLASSLEHLFIKNLSLGPCPSLFITQDDKLLYEHILENRLYKHAIWKELPRLKKIICENPTGNKPSSGRGRRQFRKHLYTRNAYNKISSEE